MSVSFSILPSLPCSSCHCDCCGPVPLSEADVRRIRRHLASQPAAEVERVKVRQRDAMTCPFVDTERWRCFVYEVRPEVCRQFGQIAGLPCPHAPAPTAVSDPIATVMMAAVAAQPIVGLASWELVE